MEESAKKWKKEEKWISPSPEPTLLLIGSGWLIYMKCLECSDLSAENSSQIIALRQHISDKSSLNNSFLT
jgi:hypothetical protein